MNNLSNSEILTKVTGITAKNYENDETVDIRLLITPLPSNSSINCSPVNILSKQPSQEIVSVSQQHPSIEHSPPPHPSTHLNHLPAATKEIITQKNRHSGTLKVLKQVNRKHQEKSFCTIV